MLGGVGGEDEITRSLHVTHKCVRTESSPETNPYQFTCFGEIHGPQTYKLIGSPAMIIPHADVC